MAIKKSKQLLSGLGAPDQVTLSTPSLISNLCPSSQIHAGQGGTALHSPKFHLLPADLRNPPSETLEPLLFTQDADKPPLLDPTFPTLLVCECVLVYISPEESSRLLRWFVEKSQNIHGGVVGCIVYEMFGLINGFGRVMVNNLKVGDLSSRFRATYNHDPI